ncbi:MAG: glycoside hydrolase family 26 protein [Oscillospiraceae bacterium]|nr:glycoside hydrolase family 26 protein [Oscillospiraceae bacterium]
MRNPTRRLFSAFLALALLLTLAPPAKAADEVTVKEWTSAEDYGAWYYGEGWEYQYSGAENSSVSYDEAMDAVKVTADYSKDAGYDWSQLAVCYYSDDLDFTRAVRAELDVLFDSSKLTKGNFKVNAYSNVGLDCTVDLDASSAETVEGDIRSAHVSITFPEPVAEKASDFVIRFIGVNTDYTGDLWMKNIKLIAEALPDTSVDSTVKAAEKSAMTGLEPPKAITLVDPDATDAVKAVYSYLQAVGASDYVLYGHQNDTWHKAGSKSLSDSDTRDVTGTIAAVVGMDTLSLVGNEYSAKRWNEEQGGTLAEDLPGNIKAAASIANKAIEEGAIITLSAHMPNFSTISEREEYKSGDPAYLRWDFSGYTPNTLEGDVVKGILPGGAYHAQYTAFLDIIAEYAKQVNGAILFRPFHENTGSWFWWGAALCDPATYKSVYKYTVEYLRDEKDVHNLLYVYGPGSEASNAEEYAERYPGDGYVDMVGFDMYHSSPSATDNSSWYEAFAAELKIVETFAKAHGKLLAVTETGTANTAEPGSSQTAMLVQGNPTDWYAKVLDMVSASDASYFLLWANFGKTSGYYTPYVDAVNEDGSLHGHELLDAFLKFYNDERTVFAGTQKAALSAVKGGTVTAALNGADGYITAPISGERVLEPVTLAAKVTGDAEVRFVLHGTEDVTLTAAAKDGLYVAALAAEDLAKLGQHVGSIDLLLDGKAVDSIHATFNIQPPVRDPYEIDGFEYYAGVDSLLTKTWATNKASGSTIVLTLDKEHAYKDEYAMKFVYDETSDGWAGATITKEVDWSGCDALRFYTIPDGKAQKVVVQLTANDTCYEVYLNEYADYAAAKEGTPLLVTVPFAEFCQRDTAGNPKGGLVEDCGKVTSFGLWVNAIGDSPAIEDGRVSGTIYYDQITAISDGPAVLTVTDAGSEDVGSEDNAAIAAGPITRSEMWALLAKQAGQDSGSKDAVRAWVIENNISDGASPERSLTRQEMATMLWRAAGEPAAEGSLSAYSDGRSVRAWAADAMVWALASGILSPEDDMVKPDLEADAAMAEKALQQ